MGCVYRLLFPNGKSYVGCTTKTLEERVRGHTKDSRAGRKLAINKAIREFGFEFEATELFFSADEHELLKAEVRFISELNSMMPFGYNLTTGGEKGFAHHPETIEKISQLMKGTRRRLGTKHTEEAKEVMRQKKLGRKLSEETKRKMSESRKRYYSIPENLEKLRQVTERVVVG